MIDNHSDIPPRLARRTGIAMIVAALLIGVPAVLLSSPAAANAQSIRVVAAAQEEIYLGEPFEYQIIIDGHDAPGSVDLTPLAAFSPRSAGGRNVSQTKVTIIQGRRTAEQTKRYVMAYELTAQQPGPATILPVRVTVDGQAYLTNPVKVDVRQPATSDHIQLKVEYSKTDCYVGEPIIMTVQWSVGLAAVDYSFSIPALNQPDTFITDDVQTPPGSGGQVARLNLGSTSALARQGSTRQGREIIVFSKVLIPRRPGRFTLDAPTVSCKVDTSGRARRDFFDGFFNDRRQYQRYLARA